MRWKISGNSTTLMRMFLVAAKRVGLPLVKQPGSLPPYVEEITDKAGVTLPRPSVVTKKIKTPNT